METDLSIRYVFSTLLWAVKILTFDAPGDIMAYSIPGDVLDEEGARRILGRQLDFSPEAVTKVKINITSCDDGKGNRGDG